MTKDERDGAVFILLSVTGYALLPIWVKTAQAAGLNSLDVATWRFGLAVPIFWLLIRFMKKTSSDSYKALPKGRLLAIGTLFAVAAVAAFWGFERLPAGTYVVLFYTYPAMVAIISAMMGERLPLTGWAALGLTIAGIFITAPDFAAGLGSGSIQGVLLALFNALVVAIYFVLSGRLLKGQTALAQGSAWSVAGAFLVLLLIIPIRAAQISGNSLADNIVTTGLSLPLATLNSADSPKIILSMLAMAALSTVLPVFFLTSGIQKVGATRASILGTIEPILTSVFAFIFLGENMKGTELLGGGLILISVFILQASNRAQRVVVDNTKAIS
ncbi:MAG: DMT family transporter [Anaerolineae bacterium]